MKGQGCVSISNRIVVGAVTAFLRVKEKTGPKKNSLNLTRSKNRQATHILGKSKFKIPGKRNFRSGDHEFGDIFGRNGFPMLD